MKATRDMIREEELWAGLNKPHISKEECDIAIFGIPFDKGVSFRSGAGEAPSALREITYTIPPTTERLESLKGLKIHDVGDIEGESREELFNNVETTTAELVKSNTFFTMIGGDHSTTIPVLRGINRGINEVCGNLQEFGESRECGKYGMDKQFGIIHIDAHFDLCDKLNNDRLSHGSTERRALELENVKDSENLFFIGIRSVEEDELDFINKNKVNVINSYDFGKLGVDEVIRRVKDKMRIFNRIYVTIDIDCLDPAYAAGTGTPQFGGLTSRELLYLLEGIFELPIIGFDVVEVAPKLDSSLTALFAARKIITECWGYYYRKNR